MTISACCDYLRHSVLLIYSHITLLLMWYGSYICTHTRIMCWIFSDNYRQWHWLCIITGASWYCTCENFWSKASGRKSETWSSTGGPVQLLWAKRFRHPTANANRAVSLQQTRDQVQKHACLRANVITATGFIHLKYTDVDYHHNIHQVNVVYFWKHLHTFVASDYTTQMQMYKPEGTNRVAAMCCSLKSKTWDCNSALRWSQSPDAIEKGHIYMHTHIHAFTFHCDLQHWCILTGEKWLGVMNLIVRFSPFKIIHDG